MSFADIKTELPKLSPKERKALALELRAFEPFDDPEVVERITRSIDDAERGVNVISQDEMLRRLRAAGRKV